MVVGVFRNETEAADAVAALRANGMAGRDITTADAQRATSRADPRRWGAAAGGAVGSAVAMILEATVLAFPSSATFLAGGTLVAAVTGLAVGASAGAAAGAGARLAVQAMGARATGGGPRRVTVTVRSADRATRERVRTVMRINRAIETRDPGYDGGLRERPALAFGFARVASQLQHEFVGIGGDPGAWHEVEPQYRYGWQLAHRPDFAGKPWDEAAGDIAAEWQRRHRGIPWAAAAPRVRAGWNAAALTEAAGDARAS